MGLTVGTLSFLGGKTGEGDAFGSMTMRVFTYYLEFKRLGRKPDQKKKKKALISHL